MSLASDVSEERAFVCLPLYGTHAVLCLHVVLLEGVHPLEGFRTTHASHNQIDEEIRCAIDMGIPCRRTAATAPPHIKKWACLSVRVKVQQSAR